MTKENIPQNRMMRMRQLTEYCALSKAYIYQKIANGTFPPGHMISSGIRAWQKSEVDAWLDKKIGGESVMKTPTHTNANGSML